MGHLIRWVKEPKLPQRYPNTSKKVYENKLFNKRRSRSAIFSVNVADKKLVEQTTNHFYIKAKLDQNGFDGELVERIPADCFRD